MRTAHRDPWYLGQLQDYFHVWRSIPSLDHLRQRWGLSSCSSARKVLDRLDAEGYVERSPANDWVPGRRFFERYLANQAVQAGNPVHDVGSGVTAVVLDELVGAMPSRTILVTVSGESMRDAGIFDGDVVVVERQHTANPGEIVVALVDGEMTVKRLLRDDQGWLLRPENPDFSDIRPGQDLSLIGVVVGLTRRLRAGSR